MAARAGAMELPEDPELTVSEVPTSARSRDG